MVARTHVEPDVAHPATGPTDPQSSLLDRLDELAAAHRRAPDPQVAREMVRLRHRAFGELVERTPPPRRPWPPEAPDRFAGTVGIPEVPAGDLDPDLLASAIVHHGCLIVRGMLGPQEVARARDAVANAYAAQDAGAADGPGWWELFASAAHPDLNPAARMFNRAGGGLWAGDSPRGMAQLVEVLEDVGVRELVSAYLEARPVMSFRKWILRTVAPADGPADWHQDGAFLGAGMRTVNLWVALSACGDDAPGMEIVPTRLRTLLPTGTPGASFDWSVAPDVAGAVTAAAPSVVPTFGPGDAALFDELLLHRTAFRPGMRRERLAAECWFFSPHGYPPGEIPLVF